MYENENYNAILKYKNPTRFVSSRSAINVPDKFIAA